MPGLIYWSYVCSTPFQACTYIGRMYDYYLYYIFWYTFPPFLETCNKEAYEEIYLGCAILLGISMLLIMIIGCMLSCSCNCCCNFEIPGELGNNVSSVGKIKLLISRNCCPPILEKKHTVISPKEMKIKQTWIIQPKWYLSSMSKNMSKKISTE